MPRRKPKADQIGLESPEPGSELLHELIARRAYELYELRRSGPCDALTDWLMAEREILDGVTGLKAAAVERIATTYPVDESKLQGSDTKPISNGSSRKKTSATTPRSAGKPKGAHP